jgi:hypothetical protein
VPAASILLPIALLAGGGLLTWALGALGWNPGRLPAAAGTWLALAATAGIWVLARTPLELAGPALGAGVRVGFRLDALAVAFLGILLFPVAVLLSGQRRPWAEAGAACLALAGCCLAIEADSVPLTALALGASAVLVMLPLRAGKSDDQPDAFSVWQAAGWILLLWAGAALLALGGTANYAAVPLASFSVPVFLLLAGSAVLITGLTPWRSWVGAALQRSGGSASWFATAAVPPVGFYLLMRAYGMGDGRYPSLWLNLVLVLLGAAVALAAALRAQAVTDRAALAAELVAVNRGIALFALGLGSPLGLCAAVTVLLGGSLVIAMLALLPEAGGAPALVAGLIATGVPPSLVFGGRLLAVQAGFEAGEVDALIALVVCAAWVLTLAAAARASWLPSRTSSEGAGSGLAAAATAGLVLVGGVALGAVELAVAIPAAAEVMTFPTAVLRSGAIGVSTTAGGWPALAFGVPLLVIGVALLWLGRAELRLAPGQEPAGGRRPRPLLGEPWALPARAAAGIRGLRLPEEYRSLFDPRALDAAASAGHPLFWLVVVAGLAYLITR